MRTGVVQILALEEDTGVEAGLLLDECGEARGFGQRARAAHVTLLERHEFLVEFGVGLGLIVDALKLVEGGDEGLGHIAAAELTPIRSLMFAERGCFGCFHLCSCLY